MKRKSRHKANLKGWTLNTIDEISDAVYPEILKAATEAVNLALEDDSTFISLSTDAFKLATPAGKMSRDDLIGLLDLELHLALDQGDGRVPVYGFSFMHALDCLIDTFVGEGFDEEGQDLYGDGFARLSAAFREYANVIDEINANSKPPNGQEPTT
jgi:hypothetical protein